MKAGHRVRKNRQESVGKEMRPVLAMESPTVRESGSVHDIGSAIDEWSDQLAVVGGILL